MSQTYNNFQKKQAREQKKAYHYKTQALIEFIQYANSKNFYGRFKIAWNILFKKIKVVEK